MTTPDNPPVSDQPAVRVSTPEEGIALVQLDRPERLNAMSAGLLRELHAALDHLAEDTSCRVVVLTGSGRGFCAGLDLTAFDLGSRNGAERKESPQWRFRRQQYIASLVPKLRGLPQPVISAVNGPAAGGGLSLALASDIRIAAESASFNVAYVRLGLSGCDIGTSWLLPRLIGSSRAFELLLTGRIIDSAEADRLGLVSRVVPDDSVVSTALHVAREILANSPMGVRMTKEVMWSQLEIGSLQAGIDLENRTQIVTTHTRDHDEAASAFRERRQPRFYDH
ncbi:enoyl-CoA hydratase [Tamaricihabitans halophyticus]|uniref:Enoyl-CoA hydratase n=1 Tax=Tamaricihabitans halophyticus TaxID=1262583 RepID=A0A4R2QM66_9PSEU|nr:enoyl-CoA hydratase-related protein [Tamaricihabitans halophyticus]TCP49969.1 enoyl-CoA hydratase [Tamaricihabitans halophyticus]